MPAPGSDAHTLPAATRTGASRPGHPSPVIAISQNAISWDLQLRSALGRRFRLVAMDLRGHGASDRPRAGYDDPSLWADDVDAAIRDLSLDQPVLCGWS